MKQKKSIVKVKDIIHILEAIAPLSFQESYDNAGLIVGDSEQEISSVLITIDTTEEVIDEAIKKQANLIISHHPLIFSGLKKLTPENYVERTVIKAIKNNISIYAAHTNIDSVAGGVNSKICEKLGLKNCKILLPRANELRKLVTFVPLKYAEKVRLAIFNAGAGHIGNYDQCSFNSEGKGTFRAAENTSPFAGNIGKLHYENEVRVETIFPKHLQSEILKALLLAHPYEEVAYDIYPLKNIYESTGTGMIGELKNAVSEITFLKNLKLTFHTKVVRYTNLRNTKIKKIAVCGGSGSHLLNNAIEAKADVFVSSDFKYHQFFLADNKILIADIGHYETEQFTKEIFYELLINKFPNFTFYLSEINSNPINYFN